MIVFRDGPAADQSSSLLLRRAPLYLRVVRNDEQLGRGGEVKWDALDLLDDTPEPGDFLYAYRLLPNCKRSWIHMNMGSGKGGRFKVAEYQFIEPQPDQEIMLDKEEWQAWVSNHFEDDEFYMQARRIAQLEEIKK